MILIAADITNYKSIENAGSLLIDPATTVLVGQNESGKTAILEALHKARSVEGADYDYVEDFPRRRLSSYEPRHATDPAIVVVLHYKLTSEEIEAINNDLGLEILSELTWSTFHRIDNGQTVGLDVPESKFVEHCIKQSPLPTEIKGELNSCTSLRKLVESLGQADLNGDGAAFRESIRTRFEPHQSQWDNLLAHYVYKKHLEPAVPEFVYFDEYKVLPGKVNLPQLHTRQSSKKLTDEDRTVLGLLRLANIDLTVLLEDGGYERAKARLEGISNTISDQVFEYWTQNQRDGVQELEVQFDIKADPQDQPPFNAGKNLYIRIRSHRHRVTVPFDKRSRGFIWFFSFLVWFDSIKHQVDATTDVVLLLDEPGLSLHALAQGDLLRYIDKLSESHQVLYSTHSPFMVRNDRFDQVRLVQDRLPGGTQVTSDVSASDEKTLFPLQAALGYSIAQNLFIARKNLLVEGPSDLIYLQFFSNLLHREGRKGLADDVVIVPVGGLDKLATFVALLGANELDIVVVHDWGRSPEQKLVELVHQKIIKNKHVLHYGQFRDPGSGTVVSDATDIEDLITDLLYLSLFNGAYSRELGSLVITELDLVPGTRLVERLSRTLKAKGVQVRPSGGYNHYLPASFLAAQPPSRENIPDIVLDRFEKLFETVNGLLR